MIANNASQILKAIVFSVGEDDLQNNGSNDMETYAAALFALSLILAEAPFRYAEENPLDVYASQQQKKSASEHRGPDRKNSTQNQT